MAKINKIVVNQVEARLTSDAREPNTYAYDENGILVRHDNDRVAKRIVGPGVLYGANKDSGDQTGLNTIKLIPNEDINTDQHLVVDPTGPNHIHLRAGGTIDASTADLVIGGENTHVYISDTDDRVTLKGSGGQFLTDPTDPDNQIATLGDLQGTNNGNFVFEGNTMFANNYNDSFIQSYREDDNVSAQLEFDPSNDQVLLRAYGDFTEDSFTSADWTTATWVNSEGDYITLEGAATVFTFLNQNYRQYSRKISVNGGSKGPLAYWDGDGVDGNLYFFGGLTEPTDPITTITFYASRASTIDIDYDSNDLNIAAENLDINLTTTGNRDIYITSADDLTLTALGDDVLIRASDDIRFTANYNVSNKEWSMDSEGRFQLPGQGYVQNPVSASGDGSGYDTLKLVPDSEREEFDQYLIVDPTGPDHIHIRAGGLQDYSEADLILGGERAGVRVSDTDGTTIVQSKQEDYSWTYENINGDGGSVYAVSTADAEPDINDFMIVDGVKYIITSVSRDVPNGITSYETTPSFNFVTNNSYTFTRDNGNHIWTFNRGGYLNGPTTDGDLRVVGIINDDGDLRVVSDTDNISINSGQDTNINANDAVRITTFGGDYGWDFGTDGKFYGPGEEGALTLGGELLTDNVNMSIRSTGQAVVLNGELGEFLGTSDDAASQIATIGDIAASRFGGSASFFSTSDQGPSDANTIQAFTFNNTDWATGVTLASTTRVTMTNAGKYNIAFSAQMHQTNSSGIVNIWLNKNGTPLANSNTKFAITANNPFSVAALNLFVNAAAGDYYELMWSSDSQHTVMEYEAATGSGATLHPAVPSIILTVNQVG